MKRIAWCKVEALALVEERNLPLDKVEALGGVKDTYIRYRGFIETLNRLSMTFEDGRGSRRHRNRGRNTETK